MFSDDLNTFRSIEAMLASIEPIDAGGVRAVFDAQGCRIVLRTDGVKAPGRRGLRVRDPGIRVPRRGADVHCREAADGASRANLVSLMGRRVKLPLD
jgi:hypothetical protein